MTRPDPPTTRRRQTTVGVGLAICIALVFVLAGWASDDPVHDAHTQTDADESADDREGAEREAQGELRVGDDERTDPLGRSAVEGPVGSRTFDGVPAELPEALVSEDAVELEGRASRDQDGSWATGVRYRSAAEQDELVSFTHSVAQDEGFARDRTRYAGDTTITDYTDETGSKLTVAVRDKGIHRTVETTRTGS